MPTQADRYVKCSHCGAPQWLVHWERLREVRHVCCTAGRGRLVYRWCAVGYFGHPGIPLFC